nr:hypothetical protein [candidate division KSB1 bacterium]NIR70627.1 hypothetical protein [candidate division KSB1 bacterium]NIS23432.1 hypothetical protein [candidate division KSB1 bacterium]NIT74567.1 hypothetical protein [candidate division KSB1 bacterium]NIU28394.1 hypothetical protein [candidate division KSB1 bacterium]
MAIKTLNFTRYSIPIVAVIILGALLGIYFFTHVPSKQQYIADRNQRLLAVMGRQIKAKVENFGTVLKNIVHEKNIVHDTSKIDSIKYKIDLVPNLERIEVQSRPATSKEKEKMGLHDHLHVHEILHNASYLLHFEYKSLDTVGIDSLLVIHAETNLAELIAPVASREEFDDILLVKTKQDTAKPEDELGKVIFQRNRSGLKVIKLDSLEDKKGNRVALSSLASSSFVKEMALSGSDFTIFGHPVLISFHDDKIESEEEKPEKWLLCGLLRTARLDAESRKISNSYIIIFMFLALTALLSIPIMKVKFMGPQDTLERLDLMFLALSFLVLTSLVTIIVFDFYIYRSHGKLFDEQLEDLAGQIKSNFRMEIESAIRQLDSLNNTYGSKPDSVVQTNILSRYDDDLSHYPYFEMVYWIDSTGVQKAKWTVKNHTTPFIEVDKRAYFYKHELKQSFQLEVDSRDCDYVLEPIYSWTTGQNETILTIPFDTVLTVQTEKSASNGQANDSRPDTISVSAMS